MIKSKSRRLGLELYILYPGEYFAVKEDCVIATLTGAAVVVCLYDITRGVGGMGNFIVPGTIGTLGIFADDIARHGIQSMELLMGEIVKKGGDRKYLKAKLFGAGYIRENIPDMGGIQDSNIRFLHDYFALEQIEIVREDLGGDYRRKIYFYPLKGKVLRRFQKRNEDSSEFKIMEMEYIDSVFRNRDKTGQVILFE
jgi:chemotaxis protein CheD